VQAVECRGARKALESDCRRLADDVARVRQAIAKRGDGSFVVRGSERDRRVRTDSEVVRLSVPRRVLQAL
jgi:hypothetical protein